MLVAAVLLVLGGEADRRVGRADDDRGSGDRVLGRGSRPLTFVAFAGSRTGGGGEGEVRHASVQAPEAENGKREE